MAKENIIFSWSGGKDSAMALYEITRKGSYKVSSLLTTVTEDYDRISMHGVRRELLERQAESLGFGLEKVLISKGCTDAEYEKRMRRALEKYEREGVRAVAFGDIFLEDLRKYREDKLSLLGMRGIFPIWKEKTDLLAKRFIDAGFKAIITCVDTKVMPAGFSGRIFDESFLADKPEGVDPCGENGEFHSFVYDGPIFRNKINFKTGETVTREERFCFMDLVPA